MRDIALNHSTESSGDSWAQALRSPKDGNRLQPLSHQEAQNLQSFTEEQRDQILSAREVIAIVARFVCKKYATPVQIGAPGCGWYWNPEEQAVTLDPSEILENPLEFSRFVMGHEGTHALITEVSSIDESLRQDQSFWFLWNRMEDPRVNNYLVDAYPEMLDDMKVAYEVSREKTLLEQQHALSEQGFYPRAAQAMDCLTQQWLEIPPHSDKFWIDPLMLDPQVMKFIEGIKENAQRSYNLYPSAEDVFAEDGREMVARYARASYKIITENIWPEFKKLVQADHLDAVTSEVLRALILKSSDPENRDNRIEILLNEVSTEARKKIAEIAQSLRDKQIELPEAIFAIPKPIKEELADKLKEFQEQLKEMHEVVLTILSDLFERLSQDSGLKLPKLEDPEISEEALSTEPGGKIDDAQEIDQASSSEFAEALKALQGSHKNEYESVRAEMKDTINKLTRDLRGILRERRVSHYKSGMKEGPFFDVERRSQEIAKGVPAHDSKAYMKKVTPKLHAEAILILVDLSGSMEGVKIEETFKATVVLCEALNRLKVPFEVLGFNDRIHELKSFKEKVSLSVHERLSGILEEVDSDRARYNDDGWALLEAHKRILAQKQERKFILVLSDGEPNPSPAHRHIELEDAVARVLKQGDVHLIGLGLGEGTEHVTTYYPGALANISAKELAGRFSRLVSEILRGKRG